MAVQTTDSRATDAALIEALAGEPVPTETLAERCSLGRGRARARLQALSDRGLVVRKGERTRAAWALTEAGRDRIDDGPTLVADGGEPDDEKFDPEVEEIPVEIGDGEWDGEGFGLPKYKLIAGALLAIVGIVVVLYLLRKLRK